MLPDHGLHQRKFVQDSPALIKSSGVGRKIPHVAIIGAGFSGSLLAIHLLRRFAPRIRVHLIEHNPSFGRGLAYSTLSPSHLLNVPAGRISAFEDDPDHFLEWLQARYPTGMAGDNLGPHTFVQRKLFGTYIQDLLSGEVCSDKRSRSLYLVQDEAVQVEPLADGAVVHLDGGRRLEVDAVVLAIGNLPPETPIVSDRSFYSSPLYKADPWARDVYDGLAPLDPVILIGTGLTMVDIALGLIERGHDGPIHAISRRGLLPRVHVQGARIAPYSADALPLHSLSALTRFIRQEIEIQAESGIGWRAVLDALRPATRQIWSRLPIGEKHRFLRHLRPWWEVHRHRTAPVVQSRIDALLVQERLRVHAGRIRSWRMQGSGVLVEYRRRADLVTDQVWGARVINCSGPACDFGHLRAPLLVDLFAKGLGRPDSLGLGVDVDARNALIGSDGHKSSNLLAIGPITRGRHWEATAVPDLRKDCAVLTNEFAALVSAYKDKSAR